MPEFIGVSDWWPASNTKESGFLNDDIQFNTDWKPLQGESSLKNTATTINNMWNEMLPDVAKTHVNGRKVKFATSIASIKSSTNFVALGPLLTGTAKVVYDIIAA